MQKYIIRNVIGKYTTDKGCTYPIGLPCYACLSSEQWI